MRTGRMGRGERFLSLVAAAIALSAAQPNGGAGQHAGTAAQNVTSAPPNAAPANQPQNTSVHDKPCRRGDDNRSSELCAQWKAADAAAEATTIASWVGTIGSILAALTLYIAVRAAIYARNAAEHTEAGAKEAKRSADLQAQAIEASLRPYVAFTEDEGRGAGPFHQGSEIKIRVKNFGQTPAANVRLFHAAEIRDKPIGSEPIELPNEPESFGKVAPGDFRNAAINFKELSKDDIADITAGRAALVMRYKIVYELPNGETDGDDVTVWIDDEGWRRGDTRIVSKKDQSAK